MARADGLWLTLKSGKDKKHVLIRLGPDNDPSKTTKDKVCHEVWTELRLEERKNKIVNLSDYKLCRKVYDLSCGFDFETQWLLETIVKRLPIDLDKEDPNDE